MEEDCLKEMRCANGRQNHPAYARSCEAYKKEKEIFEVKHKRNVSFLEARKIVGTHMSENSYASVARRADTINQENRYRALEEKLIQLKNLHSPELQTQPRPANANKEKVSETTTVKSPTNKQTLLFKPKLFPPKENHRLNLILTDRQSDYLHLN